MQKFKVLSSKKQRKSDKSVRLVFPKPMYERMMGAFAASEAVSMEGYAIAQCGLKVDGSRKRWDYLVRSLHIPAKEDLFERSSITVTPRAEFIENILSDAAIKHNQVLEVHTHVGSSEPNFSWIDIENGLENGRFLRSCGLRFAMAVIGVGGFSFCEYEADNDALQIPESARITVLGRRGLKDAIVHKGVTSCEIRSCPGPGGMTVGIAGLDGVGFTVASLLAGKGVKKFILLDEGRVVEGGKKKTKAALNMLKKISDDIEVVQVRDLPKNARAMLKECDLIFCCGADAALRDILSDVSLRYFIPCIEARSLKKADKDGFYGRVRVFVPPLSGCIGCFDGCGEIVADATASINNAAASIAVQEFMDIAFGVDGVEPYDVIEWDGDTQQAEKKVSGRNEACPMCGENGIAGAGDERKPRKP
jgi:molybdopterin/thiamine biosynthesis adenylyltransferase